jgi:hypothetical protein
VSDFNAGSARGTYILDISQAEQAAARLKALFAQIKADAAGIGRAGGGGATPELDRQAQAARRAAAETDRLRDSEIRLARAQGDRGRALQLVNTQLQSATPNTLRYNKLLIDQANILKQGNSLSQQFSQGITSGIAGIIGPAAIATAAIGGLFAAVQGGIAAGGEALALREQRNSLRAVAGDTALYAEAVAVARQQQLLFGGTIRENLDGIQGLTIVSRESGASLKQLIDLTQRLQLKSPEQGVGGARIAITEALSGNVTSLARRFEIPREALKGLSDTTLPVAERLAIIDTYLAKIGITSEAVTGRVDADAAAFRRFNAELEQTQLRVGDQLATAFSGAATGLSRLLGVINDNPQAIAELKAIRFGGDGVVSESDLKEAERIAARRQANSLTATTSEQLTGVNIASAEDTANMARARDLLTDFIAAGGGAAETARGLAGQFQNNTITTGQLVTELERLKNTSQGIASPFSAAASAIQVVTNATGEQAIETLKANVEAEKQKRVMASIALQSSLVQKGFITQAQGANILRGQLGAAADEAIRLQIELGRSAAISAQKTAPLSSAEKSFIDRANAGKPKDASARLTEERKLREAQEAYQRSLLQFQPVANQLAAKRAELAKIGQDDPRRFQVMTEIARLQNQLENEKSRLAKGHTSELNKQLGLNESIYDSQQKQYRAALDLEELSIRNRQETRKEDEELRRLRNTAANASDPRIRAAAQDAIALIDVERRQRQAEIGEKQGITGAPIVNGRILESLRGTAAGGGGSGTSPAAPGTPAGGAGAAGGAGLTIVNQFYVDSKLLLEVIEPQIIANALAGQRASTASGVGAL